MTHRRRLLAGLAAIAAAGPGAALARAAGRPPHGRTPQGRTPQGRTPQGRTPQRSRLPGRLDGVWTMATYTDLERPKELPALALTAAQAEAYEAPRRALGGMPPAKAGEVGQAESEFTDRGAGLARVHGEIRSSWIVDPPDGRIPFRPEVLARLGLDKTPPIERLDNPEERPGNERCVATVAAGAPMIGAADTNLFQIVEVPGAIAILTEKYHDVRIIRLQDGPAMAPPPAWLGDSVGRWEGRTLVVETSDFRPGLTHRGVRLFMSGETRVTERFTRAAPDEIFYEFTVEDPSLYTRPWRGEMVMHATRGRIFEYACHEGNYGMANVLSGAREAEKAAAAGR